MAVVEFDDPPNGIRRQVGIVFTNLFDVASAFEVVNKRLGLYVFWFSVKWRRAIPR